MNFPFKVRQIVVTFTIFCLYVCYIKEASAHLTSIINLVITQILFYAHYGRTHRLGTSCIRHRDLCARKAYAWLAPC